MEDASSDVRPGRERSNRTIEQWAEQAATARGKRVEDARPSDVPMGPQRSRALRTLDQWSRQTATARAVARRDRDAAAQNVLWGCGNVLLSMMGDINAGVPHVFALIGGGAEDIVAIGTGNIRPGQDVSALHIKALAVRPATEQGGSVAAALIRAIVEHVASRGQVVTISRVMEFMPYYQSIAVEPSSQFLSPAAFAGAPGGGEPPDTRKLWLVEMDDKRGWFG